ncbi:hypothetical protein CDL12_16593 [Handroanthus impetiginosus]|uniref:Uncharacterized protein n=1 Tax=Handroanthus impetiginosus TaxID=429701 RepID=A0A2G9GZY8_9LAMI|nr:hypothetical protein CDL12_16593 [Handroanthus impetiginosus]
MERETRRKKISSQEADRMAMITGRIQIPDPGPLNSSSFSNLSQDERKEEALFQDHYNHCGDNLPNIQTHNSHVELSEENNLSDLHNLDEKEEEAARSLVLTPRVSHRSNDTNLPERPFEYHLSSITPKDINFSIISSENTRALCSFVIAVLVVLSHINLPHNVVKPKSLIADRPLYAVLLTDMLIVAARLALYSMGREEDDNTETSFGRDGDNWEGAVKLLEWGLVLHQTLRAIFIDCSFYLVIVVCGLSLV